MSVDKFLRQWYSVVNQTAGFQRTLGKPFPIRAINEDGGSYATRKFRHERLYLGVHGVFCFWHGMRDKRKEEMK